MQINKINKFNKTTLIVVAAVVIVTGGAVGWWAGSGRAQQSAGVMPAGAVPISPRFIADYDKATERFKAAQAEITVAQKIVKRAMELSLSDANISLDKFDDYRLDDIKKWMVPLTEQEKLRAKKANELQQQFNQQLQTGQ